MNSLKEAPISAVLKRGRKMEKGSSHGAMARPTQGSGWPEKDTESACGLLRKGIATWESGNEVLLKVKVSTRPAQVYRLLVRSEIRGRFQKFPEAWVGKIEISQRRQVRRRLSERSTSWLGHLRLERWRHLRRQLHPWSQRRQRSHSQRQRIPLQRVVGPREGRRGM
jgi:hypothetical protein